MPSALHWLLSVIPVSYKTRPSNSSGHMTQTRYVISWGFLALKDCKVIQELKSGTGVVYLCFQSQCGRYEIEAANFP